VAPAATVYRRAQTERWLSWMARHLRRQGRTIFLLERVDESWLGSRGRKLAYLSIFAVVFSLGIGSVLAAFDELSVRLDTGGNPVAVDLELWWLGTFLWALAAGVLTWFRPGWLPSAWLRRRRWWPTLLDLAAFWLVWLAIWGLFPALATGRVDSEWLDSGGDLGRPVLVGLLTVVAYGFRYGLGNVQGRVPTVEALGWSWRSAVRGLFSGLILGGVLWVIYWWFWRDSGFATSRNLAIYLPVGGACGFLAWGLRMRLVDKSRPNEGIRRSFANALIAGALCAPGIALVCWPAFGYAFSAGTGALGPGQGALYFGALGGVIAALWFGGMDVLRHGMLRLALAGRAPWHWKGFLDYAASLGLLRRVGGGYMFVHRFLLDHFADREPIATGS
jgi:hypothetical protein